MALEMRQRLVIGEASEMKGPTDPSRTALIYPYVRTVRLEESRFDPLSVLNATIPPYPNEMIKRLRTGMVLRWEAGYWEDDRPLYKGDEGSDGYHTEFEGIITEVSRRNHYDGFDPDGLMRSDNRRDGLAIGIQAKDYMYRLAQTKLDPPEISGSIESIMPQLLSAGEAQPELGLTYMMRFNEALINPSGLAKLSASTPAMAFYHIRNSRGPVDKVIGLDIYFRLKELQLVDPNDPAFASGNYPIFVVGDNVIEEDLVPRTAKFIQVIARWYDPETGVYHEGRYPLPGSRDYVRGQNTFGGEPAQQIFDIEGDASGGMPNVQKDAEDIYARIAGDGLVGSFLAFGYPPVHRGNIIIYAGNDPARQKAVLVDRVIKVYDAEQAKFRQEISPGFTPTPIQNPLVGDTSMETFAAIKKSQAERAKQIQADVRKIIDAIRMGGGP
jgi:hypothetical protein